MTELPISSKKLQIFFLFYINSNGNLALYTYIIYNVYIVHIYVIKCYLIMLKLGQFQLVHIHIQLYKFEIVVGAFPAQEVFTWFIPFILEGLLWAMHLVNKKTFNNMLWWANCGLQNQMIQFHVVGLNFTIKVTFLKKLFPLLSCNCCICKVRINVTCTVDYCYSC